MKPKSNLRSGLLPFVTTFTFALTAPYAFAETETFNTAGTTTWVCPNGVSTIQVECWGGGGAGGLGKGVATGTSQNAGGGGGGAYARKASVPVTPGFSYTITIPPAAVSGSGGQTGNGQFVNGGAVTFTGDSVTVTAAGGGGGRNIVVTTNATSRGVGGPAGTTAASVGDVGGVFAGGAGAAGTLGALNSQDNSSGAGGGGAGNAAAGGNALAGTGTGSTPGAGGVAGGGAGGTGRIGANTNTGVGGNGATPGGGGGGGKNVGNTTQLGGTGGLGQITLTYTVPPNFKANNADDLDEPSSWTAFVPTGSIAKWDATVTGANTVSLGSDLSFAGIALTDPGGPVTINSGNLLTLGAAAVDIDLTTATQDLTLNNNLALGAANVWNVAAPRTLTVGGAVSGSSTVTTAGDGTVVLAGANIHTGSTIVTGGTLNITGSITGSPTASKINISPAAGNAIVNYNGGTSTLFAITGATTLGTSSVFNLTGGAVNMASNTTTGTQTVTGGGNAVGNGTYGFYNITGGVLKNSARFTVTGQAAASATAGPVSGIQTAVVFVGGDGLIDQTNSEWWLNYSLGQVTVADSGKIDRTGSTQPYGIIMNHAANVTGGGYGVLNLAGSDAEVVLGTQSMRFGNSTTATQGSGQSGFVNLAAGTLSTGGNFGVSLPAAPVTINNAYFNFAGGTLKATGNLTNLIPVTNASLGSSSTLFGPVDNAGTATDFSGGLTFDTSGFAVTVASPFLAAGGAGVTQADLSITGGSGYVGAPAVLFSSTDVTPGGSPAAGYAVVSGGAVTGIVITSPGTYAPGITPTVSLIGGGGTGAAVTSGPLNTLNSAGGLTKSGTGSLVLSGANTYTGPTLVNAGLLQVSGSGSLAGTSGLSVAGAAAFNYLPATIGSPLTLGAGSTLNLGSSSTLGLSWDATTASSIAVSGAASIGSNVLLNLSGSYASGTPYTILTAASGLDTGSYGFLNAIDTTFGVIQSPTSVIVTPTSTAPLGAAYWTGTATTGLTKVWAASDAALDSNWAATAPGSAQGLVPGSGADVFISADTVTTAPTNTVLGANMSIKSLTIADTTNGLGLNADGNSLTITPAAATAGISMTAGVPASSIGANLVLGADQTWTNDSASTLGISGNVSGSFGLTKAGTGTIALSGGLSVTGPVAISAGNLALSPAGALTLTNAFTGAATLTANPGTTNLSLNGDLSGFTGSINVSAPVASPGKLVTGATSPLGTGAVVNIANGATWFTNNATQTGITVNLAGIGNGEGFGALRSDPGTFDATSSLVLQVATTIGGLTGTATINSVISENVGPFSLTKVGSGTLTLGGSNTYTGGTTIAAGILSATNSNALGSGPVSIAGGIRLVVGTGLDVTNAITIGTNAGTAGNGLVQAGTVAGTATVSGPITINNGAAAGGHFAAPTANTVLHLAGAITSVPTISHRAGTVMYSGGGTGYADLWVTGTAMAGVDNGIATSATVTLGTAGAAGTFDLNGFNQTLVGIAKAASPGTIGNSSTTADSTLTTTGTSAYSGVIQDVLGSGTRKVNLAVAGGELTLSAANAFSGDITVSNGTLIGAGATNGSGGVSVLGSRLNTRTITVSSGGTLQFNSGNILGANHVATTAPTLVINSGGVVTNGGIATNNALNDIQLNSGTLTSTTGHTGSTPPNLPVYGAWNLNGSVTSNGVSTISTTDPTKGWVMLKVVGDKTTNFNVASGSLTVSAPVVDNPVDSNIGSLSKSGAGDMTLTAINTYTGSTTVTEGALTLADNAQLKFALGATSGVNNSISGAGTVTLAGDFVIDTTAADALSSGSWTLENVASLTGPYEDTFTVVGFTDAGDNQWTKTVSGKTYTFDETTGILKLGGGYSSWAAVNAPTGTSGDDFDGDGVSNAVEYVLGGDKDTNDLGKLPVLSTAGGNLVFSFKRDQESIDGTPTMAVQVGTTLASWPLSYAVGADTAGSAPEVTVAKDSPATGTDTVTLTIPQSPDLKKFARLNVTVTP